ncbi:MAG: energy-coupling factor transporter transmembrane protein EcfT [Acidobacteriia bacterium]|nr:energy-coupling factor transporter transmembrane protein EcfT [Terriglobia bacterium]
MHHLVIDRWSRGSSSLHQRDPRAKLAALLVFLIVLSTTRPAAQWAFAAYAIMLIIAVHSARLPILGLAGRAALVLPFSATFALLTWWSGDTLRALALAEKSFLSGMAALLLVATTPLTGWTAALESWRAPRMLILVIQFVYRYLFVIAEQAQRMRWAAVCRGSHKTGGFRLATGLVGVLFARSWQRADGIYHAMLARGFRGRFVPAAPAPFRAADALFFSACLAGCLAVRILL